MYQPATREPITIIFPDHVEVGYVLRLKEHTCTIQGVDRCYEVSYVNIVPEFGHMVVYR